MGTTAAFPSIVFLQLSRALSCQLNCPVHHVHHTLCYYMCVCVYRCVYDVIHKEYKVEVGGVECSLSPLSTSLHHPVWYSLCTEAHTVNCPFTDLLLCSLSNWKCQFDGVCLGLVLQSYSFMYMSCVYTSRYVHVGKSLLMKSRYTY